MQQGTNLVNQILVYPTAYFCSKQSGHGKITPKDVEFLQIQDYKFEVEDIHLVNTDLIFGNLLQNLFLELFNLLRR